MATEKRVTLDLFDVRHYLEQHPTMYQVRWIPTTAMLVDALTKREDLRFEGVRNKARADNKERA